MLEIYPWQTKQMQTLLLMHQQNRMPHALLLSGPDGIGLKHFALVFVMRMLCLSNKQLDTACGDCKSCELFNGKSHPDLYFIEPEEKGKTIKIEQIRKLIEYASNKSFSADTKIVVIKSADTMNRFAAPALLKTLEEPPEQTKIILLSHNPSRLPITIRSRCQRIDFKPIYDGKAVNWLNENLEPSEIAPATSLLHLSGGAPLKALELAADEQLLACRDKLIQNLDLLDKKNGDPVKIAEYWYEIGPDNTVFWLLRLISDLIRLKLSPKKADITNIDLREDLQGLSNRLELLKLVRGYEFISLKYKELGGPMNYSPRSILEEIALFWKNLTIQY